MMTKYNYVTLFNSAYLNRGLVMYESLKAVCNDFTLFVVCFDANTHAILKALNYEQLIPVSLGEFEDEKLLSIKPGRTATEYCWTCSASVIWYCINTYKLPNCAYIDADIFFYSSPDVIWNEDPSSDVIITLHNYTKAYDQSAISGKFCVQFVGFRNTANAMQILEEWRENCIAWCYNRVEDGKFGDQKYLDVWPQKFKGVHVVKNPAVGLAPWNIQQFRIKSKDEVFRIADGRIYQPVFYHFHKLRLFKAGLVSFSSSYYHLEDPVLNIFYFPYAGQLLKMDAFLLGRFKGVYTATYPEGQLLKKDLFTILKLYFYYVRKSLRNVDGKVLRQRLKNDYTFKVNI